MRWRLPDARKRTFFEARAAFERFLAGWRFAAQAWIRREDSMPGKKPGPSIKRPKTYEALKKKGMSKTRAAKISNAQAKKS